MMEYLNWYGQHPWLGTFILMIASDTIVGVFVAIFRRKNNE